jgi:hypothetical protein
MMTMLSAMPKPFSAARIIGAVLLLLALAGCSLLRLSYPQAPRLVYWWLDDYVDFSDEQAPQARQAIAAWFGWHRSTQLGDYVVLLERARAQVLEPITPAIACEWQDLLQQRGELAFGEAVPALAQIAQGLSPAQLQRIEHRLAEKNEEFREENLPDDPAERQQATLKRGLKRIEMLYGRLSRAQRDSLARGLAQSPFDGELWDAERHARQQDLLRLLRAMDRHDPGAVVALQAALRRWSEQLGRSPRPAYRAYQERLDDYNCRFAAQIHNATTPAQRQAAQAQLKSWEDDLRSLRTPAPARDVRAPAARAPGAG